MTVRYKPRPDIIKRIPLDRDAVIEASAGTGKTFTLEHLVVELLVSTDVAVDRLLVVTFTEKATQELRARIRAKLEELCSGAFDPATESQAGAGDAWRIDDAVQAKLARSLHALDGAAITTIHAFCQRVLRDNAFAGGRLFKEQQVDAREAFGRALRDVLRQDVASDPARARWLEGALAQGWTISRLEDHLWKVATARADLHPTFDPAELEAAIEDFPVEDARRSDLQSVVKSWGVHANTARSVAQKLYKMSEFVDEARSNRDPVQYLVAIEDEKIDFGPFVSKLAPVVPPPGAETRLHAAGLRLAHASVSLAAALVQTILPVLLRTLARNKREAGRYDFDDMLLLVDEALRGPRGGALADALRRRFAHVFIDEFQDTDETQWSIFRRAFYEASPRTREPPSRLVLIGDPKQSIYRFRGADVETYLSARADILSLGSPGSGRSRGPHGSEGAPGGANIVLEQNYRATPALVDATNALFDPSAPEPLFHGSIVYAPVACGRLERALTDGHGDAVSPIEVLRFQSEVSLAALGAEIAREIRTLTDPKAPYRLDGRPLGPKDIFVLTRTTQEGLELGRKLEEARVPYAFYKEEGLFQSEEARDVRAVLAAIDDPAARATRLSAWMTPFFGLMLADVEYARDLPDTHPFMERLGAWKVLADRRDFDRLFESILWGSGILRREIFFAQGERSLTNYMHLFEVLAERAHAGHKTLGDLALDLAGLRAKTKLPLDIEGNVQRLESERSAVQIMTIHKAKGLEAPVVFVAGGLSPAGGGDQVRVYHEGGRRSAWVGKSAPEDVSEAVKLGEREEDQRLMYVALTRPMGRLYLPYAPVPPAGQRGRKGPYDPVNRRIGELLARGEPTFSVRDVAPEASSVVLSASAAAPATDEWHPPPALLRDPDDRAAYDELRSRHAGALVTSYTRMKAKRSGARGGWAKPAEDRREESAIERIGEKAEGVLRPARASGIFLHELLERVPLGSFASAGDVKAWRARGDVGALVTEAMAVHRVDPAQREHAEQLVWSAYTTPVTLPGGARIAGFASAARIAREMEFVFPPQTTRESVHGYVRGSLDLAFEHDGLTYFVDWKSDLLGSYAREALVRHVAEHYEEQGRIYALAVTKLLGIRTDDEYRARFGGFLYCFLRGFDETGAGLWSRRPAFADLAAWEDALRLSGPGGET